MAWVPLIENIITQGDLGGQLSAFSTTTQMNTLLNDKLNADDGIASNLTLENVGTENNSAITLSVMNNALASRDADISTKADKDNPVFTGTVTLGGPATVNEQAVQLIQITDKFLELTGGTVTGLIKCGFDPIVGDDLANKSYIDTNFALQTDLDATSVTVASKADASELAGYAPLTGNVTFDDNIFVAANPSLANHVTTVEYVGDQLDLFAPLASAAMTDTEITGLTVLGTATLNGVDIATTADVSGSISTLSGTLTSAIDLKANIASPVFSGSPTLASPVDPLANDGRVVSADWVRQTVDTILQGHGLI